MTKLPKRKPEPKRKAAKPRKFREKPGDMPGHGPQLVEQAHGGSLWHGGHPHPTPGSGRPSLELRARMRGSLAERIGVAEAIADNPSARDIDRLGALAFLARFGLGTSDENVVEVASTGGDAMRALRQALIDELERLGPQAFTAELEQLLDEPCAPT